jgi:SNF2 family DNA or RNA helicase
MGWSDNRWHLCTYQALARDPSIVNEDWDVVILDESTMIKNPRNKTSKLVVRRLSRTRNRAILTGCIDPEDITDVWAQMAFVMGGKWMGHANYWKWRQHHKYQAGFSWVFKPGHELKVREQLAQDAHVVTRKSAGVGNEKVYSVRSAPMDPECERYHKQIVKTWKSDLREAKHSVSTATWLHRLAGGHTPEDKELPCWKVDEVVNLVTGELAGEQFVVWFAFSLEMRRVFRALKAAGVSSYFVQGQTPLEQRRSRRLGFERKERRGMLIQGRCGKFGYDLSASSVAIYYSNPWSGETRRQSEDRIESLSKCEPLLIIDLISKGSVDEDVLASLKEKHESSDETARFILERQQLACVRKPDRR